MITRSLRFEKTDFSSCREHTSTDFSVRFLLLLVILYKVVFMCTGCILCTVLFIFTRLCLRFFVLASFY